VLAAIAKKSIKEVSYHKRFSGDWIKRLGDGTEESHNRMQEAFDNLWTFTNELFLMTADDTAMVEAGVGVDVDGLKAAWTQEITALLTEATLTVPDLKYFLKGGKEGIHSEHMGFILTEMQYMQRTYPNMTW
ncbi:1,2-phenylacetyl-CoA epoxidase subunit PaaC, partial [Flavobacterium sp.]